MNINGWKYYNHAVIPDTPPHITPNTKPIEDGSIWNIKEKPLLARWTTDFDCGYETNWWYVIKDAPFEVEQLDAKVRKHIRQALKKNEVRKINPAKYSTELCEVHNKACQTYKGWSGSYATQKQFENKNENDFWAAFNVETGKIVGYMICKKGENYIETLVSKYDPEYLNQRASDAIHYTVLQYYLNENDYKYVSSGTRSISHITNVQEYKIKTFGFRKAYCKFRIAYNPQICWIIKILYPFRNILLKMDSITYIHKINAILQMNKIFKGVK